MIENFDFNKNFAENVFTEAEMKKRLSEKTYNAYKKAIADNTPLSLEVADDIAGAMKEWALEKGATHYTHWFQPMTGFTAEKHESFLEPDGDGFTLKFSGKTLVKGESDASSFPNGGLRATFEARGYTAWDPSSYAFIKDGTLYIPTVFCSYGGEALDKKAPLLRSMEAVDKQAKRILALFGNDKVKRVFTTVGAEQEYFLVDKETYAKRLDLVTCGRTLFGAKPPKGQQLEDHYYGKIKMRVKNYMADLDRELWKLGIFAKTKHNEVAPAQHELACVYSQSNIAVDHNQLVMAVMKSVANKHGLVCLLHEKPFDGINGSGKHNNWSMATDTGVNLLEPGETPADNAQFLLFLTAVIAAVDDYQDLLRISAASASNDNRLGGNEAPPAVISMYIGEELEGVLSAIENGATYIGKEAATIKFGAGFLPNLPKDKTDRNRTSPFAFTGNKFEFRAVGSSMSIAGANIVLNAIVADELQKYADKLEKSKDFNLDLFTLIREEIKAHKRIIFNGNNYSSDWIKEAEKRGLMNLPTTVDALSCYLSEKNLALYKRQNIFSVAEAESRYEIQLENYSKSVDIEAKTMLVMARTQILPSMLSFLRFIEEEQSAKCNIGISLPSSYQIATIKKLSECIDGLYTAADKTEYDLSLADGISDNMEKAKFYKDKILPDMNSMRSFADDAEKFLGKDFAAIPSYTDVLNSVKLKIEK